jgi:hypothetical protein
MRHVGWLKFANVSEVLAAFIIKATSLIHHDRGSKISETSANLYETRWCNNLADNPLHSHCHENLKSDRVVLLPKRIRIDKIS